MLDFYNDKSPSLSANMEAENQLFFNTCLASNISPENALELLHCNENVANDINPLVLLILMMGLVVNNGFHVCEKQILFLVPICNAKVSSEDRMRVLAEYEKTYGNNEYLIVVREKVNRKMAMKTGASGC